MDGIGACTYTLWVCTTNVYAMYVDSSAMRSSITVRQSKSYDAMQAIQLCKGMGCLDTQLI